METVLGSTSSGWYRSMALPGGVQRLALTYIRASSHTEHKRPTDILDSLLAAPEFCKRPRLSPLGVVRSVQLNIQNRFNLIAVLRCAVFQLLRSVPEKLSKDNHGSEGLALGVNPGLLSVGVMRVGCRLVSYETGTQVITQSGIVIPYSHCA